MTSTDQASIEAITYLGCSTNRLSRIEILQHQQFHHMAATSAAICEHNCNCIHNHQPLGNHHHHGNFSAASSSNVAPNGPYTHHHNHFNHNHLNQHIPNGGYLSQPSSDGNLIYNNSSTNSECNQPVSNNDGSQSGCSMIHYVPSSNLSVNSQNLNIPNVPCDCGHSQHIPHHHHQRQLSVEQQSLQSGRSSRIISCDENNPSGTEDGSGMSTSGMITGCRASKRNLWVKLFQFHSVVMKSSKLKSLLIFK